VQCWDKAQQDLQSGQEQNAEQCQQVDRMVRQFQTTISSVAENAETSQNQITERLSASAAAMQQAWGEQLEAVGKAMTDQVVRGWGTIQEDVRAQQQENMARLQKADQIVNDLQSSIADIGQRVEATQKQLNANAQQSAQVLLKAWHDKLETLGEKVAGDFVRKWDEIQQDVQQQQQESATRLREIDRMVGEFQATMAGMSQQAESAQGHVAESLRESADALQGYVAGLQSGLEGLSAVLSDLGEKQVLVQQVPRRGWFFGRGNGGK
jgi:DNA anti-recombination protein RmuC